MADEERIASCIQDYHIYKTVRKAGIEGEFDKYSNSRTNHWAPIHFILAEDKSTGSISSSQVIELSCCVI